GFITMPLIGAVAARERTTTGLSAAIAEKLRNGYIREPHVAVEIEAYRPFFILGEVTAPGQYPYVANMTAETAVAIAGGFSPRAAPCARRHARGDEPPHGSPRRCGRRGCGAARRRHRRRRPARPWRQRRRLCASGPCATRDPGLHAPWRQPALSLALAGRFSL